MADDPDNEEPETFVQKAVKIGLIAIPIMMYISWAHKKFVPCPKVKCHQAAIPRWKRPDKNNKDMEDCNGQTKADEQDYMEYCKETRSNEREPSKQEYMGYLKNSFRKCCEMTKSQRKDYSDCSNGAQNTKRETCKTETTTTADPCSQSQSQSGTISPEAFDKLFEQHFQKCVDEFKEHKKRIEEEIKRLKEECEREEPTIEKPKDDKKGKYLECLADLNMDKEFERDESFYSKDLDTPYVVKDYKCKTTRKKKQAQKIEKAGFLQCLTDLNMDKHFEDTETNTQSRSENECCPKSKTKGAQEECDDGVSGRSTTKGTQEECDDVAGGRSSPKHKGGVSNIYTKSKLDDCGCDPHTNTMDTGNYGTTKGDPCADRNTKDEDSDDDALKDFWHACGPPKGLRTGCRAEACRNSNDKDT